MNCSASAIRLRTSAAALRGRSLRQGSTPLRVARLRAAAPAVCFLDDKAGTVVVSFSLTRKVTGRTALESRLLRPLTSSVAMQI